MCNWRELMNGPCAKSWAGVRDAKKTSICWKAIVDHRGPQKWNQSSVRAIAKGEWGPMGTWKNTALPLSLSLTLRSHTSHWLNPRGRPRANEYRCPSRSALKKSGETKTELSSRYDLITMWELSEHVTEDLKGIWKTSVSGDSKGR